MANEEKQWERNLKAIQLEKEGNVEEAIKLYEQSIKENFDGNHPYDRLAIIYRKQGKKEDEIRVLNHAIYVFENIVYSERGDRVPKLEKFKKRLAKIKK
jgi:tetratricopeptide (TPR) repeat protein